MSFSPDFLSSISKEPGVYLMKDNTGIILYIGKAKNLRQRITQYFTPGRDGRLMIPFLTAQVTDIDTIVTFSEKEALLLENTLIKRHQPKYNILLKDDKSFVSLFINTSHAYPMIKIIRYKQKPKGKGMLFGPYTSAYAARQTVEIMGKIFQLRQCSDRELQSRTRPCILHSIKRCLAPCVGKCTQSAYSKEVQKAIAFLEGDSKEVICHLQREMEKASKELAFERAGAILQTIHQLEHVTQEKQSMISLKERNCDALALCQKGQRFLIVKLPFRGGKLIGAEKYCFEELASDEEELWETFLLQHYEEKELIPTEILLPISLSKFALLSEILTERKECLVRLLSPKKGDKNKLVALAKKNAATLFPQKWSSEVKEDLLLQLQEVCQLTRYPEKIECFDTSHIAGTNPVACMVHFERGVRNKKITRLFTIKKAKGGDDYGAMSEAIYRHYSKAKESGFLPDLVLIDGGKGHLQAALAVFTELGIATIDTIALSKEEARHDKGLRKEKVYIPHKRDPILLPLRSSLLFLLQQIRDETHQVAISFQRKRRQKKTVQSVLDQIPGIGIKKRTQLLKHFGSAKKVSEASEKELKEAGLSKRDIENLQHFFLNPSSKRNLL